MNEAEMVVVRAWRGDVLIEELTYHRSRGAVTVGPHPFRWVLEVHCAGKSDRVNVPRGVAMTWEPILR